MKAARTEGPQTQLGKSGTPTMGGVLIRIATGLSTLLWGDLENRYVWVVLLVTLGTGAVGCSYSTVVRCVVMVANGCPLVVHTGAVIATAKCCNASTAWPSLARKSSKRT